MRLNDSPAPSAMDDGAATREMTPSQMSDIRAEDEAGTTITPTIAAAAAANEKSPSAEEFTYNMDGEEKKAEPPSPASAPQIGSAELKHALNKVDGGVDFFDEVQKERRALRKQQKQKVQRQSSLSNDPTTTTSLPVKQSPSDSAFDGSGAATGRDDPLTEIPSGGDSEMQRLHTARNLSSSRLGDMKKQQTRVQQQSVSNDPQTLLVDQSLDGSPFDWLEGSTGRDDLKKSAGGDTEMQFATGLRQQSTMKRRLPQSTFDKAFDVESQSKKALSQQESSPSRSQERRAAARDPAVSIRVLLRKIAMAIITDIDDETLRREDTEAILIAITLLKEAMLGVIIAFFLVSFLLTLDHRLLLRLPTARNFRKATFAVMNDQETLKNFEENAGLKFMNMEEYESNMLEIAETANKTKLAEKILAIRSVDLVQLKQEMLPYHVEFPELFSKLGLDEFCDTCVWGMRLTCMQRVEGLESTYNTPKFEAMVSAMQKESCKKSPEQVEKERKQKVLETEILKDWEGKNEKVWCSDCEWDASMSCNQRVSYLSHRYGTPSDRAKATVMVETENCRNSFHEEQKEKLAKFCKECTWSNKMTCQQRVAYLMYTYQNSEVVATKAAMETPACVRPE